MATGAGSVQPRALILLSPHWPLVLFLIFLLSILPAVADGEGGILKPLQGKEGRF